MSNIQLEAFGEVFSSPRALARFQNRNFTCPFDSRIEICDKPNRGEFKYGNCTVKVGQSKRIICPRRFYEDNFRILRDIKNFIFPNINSPINCYDEIRISKETTDRDRFTYGNLDWILINSNNPNDFCGVEIQTDATTGTGKIKEGIEDLLNGTLRSHYNFGLNTLASFKGFLPQFIFKGQLFDDWKKPYCAIIQDELWEKFKNKFRIRHKEITSYSTETFLFFVYFLEYSDDDNRYHIGQYKIFASRWIDLLFSFSVESELLINLSEIQDIIIRRINSRPSTITL